MGEVSSSTNSPRQSLCKAIQRKAAKSQEWYLKATHIVVGDQGIRVVLQEERQVGRVAVCVQLWGTYTNSPKRGGGNPREEFSEALKSDDSSS